MDVHIKLKRDMNMSEKIEKGEESTDGIRQMLNAAGYSEKAVNYYMEKPHMGILPNPDLAGEMTGTCGDTMEVYLTLVDGKIKDAKYEVMGCAGAVSAAMAAVDLIKGKTLEEARKLDDGQVYGVLEEIPVKKHHCIQLAVKTLHKAIDSFENKS